MKCSKVDCHWSDITQTSPCCVCQRQVHHLCSNKLCSEGELSQRFCSRACVHKVFSSEDSESQRLTPSSTSSISCSSNATVIDLREKEVEKNPDTINSIPDHITHSPPANSTAPIWNLIHRLSRPITHKSKHFTHICMLCLKTKTWKESLCRASNASNAKTHLVLAHKDHEMAIQERQHRQRRTDRYMVISKTETKQSKEAELSSQENRPTKRQKTWCKVPVSQEQISDHIARWLIHDRLAHHVVTTPAMHDFLVGVTGDPNVTVPSSKLYNEILDNHYDSFTKDTSELFLEEFKELDDTPFMTAEHDLWTNSTKNSIVGVSSFYIDRQWRPVRLALLAEVKNDGHDSGDVSTLINRLLKARFGMDINRMARFTISDTAPGARKISRQFDTTLQTDCAMHILNLCISYGIGLTENVRNDYIKDATTKLYVKKRVVVAKGGAFPEGGVAKWFCKIARSQESSCTLRPNCRLTEGALRSSVKLLDLTLCTRRWD